MALFKPIKDTLVNIQCNPIVEGQFLVATDTGEMFLDVSNSARIAVGGGEWNVVEVTSGGAIPLQDKTVFIVKKTSSATGISIWAEQYDVPQPANFPAGAQCKVVVYKNIHVHLIGVFVDQTAEDIALPIGAPLRIFDVTGAYDFDDTDYRHIVTGKSYNAMDF